jgi:cell fate (sporulation/competence/biofilm development) regulator YlbF (YheA/YmcA/DUF963 family)
MFGLFKKDPVKKLTAEYQKLQEKAMNAQRNGKIELFGELSFQAQQVLDQINEQKKLLEDKD